jgi:hypothetical protein
MFSFQVQSASQLYGDARILSLLYNGTATTLTIGTPVAYAAAAAWLPVSTLTGTYDGFTVGLPAATSGLDLFAGIVAGTTIRGGLTAYSNAIGIPVSMPGWVTVSGVATVTVSVGSITNSSITVTIGDKMLPSNGQTYLIWGKGGDGYGALINSLGAFTGAQTVTLQSIQVLVKCV